MDDKDIYKTASELIVKYGKNAIIEAAMQSDRMMDCGDLHGAGYWNKVMAAIEKLQ